MWIPLRPTEPEPDAQKAQKLEEMIVILRKVRVHTIRAHPGRAQVRTTLRVVIRGLYSRDWHGYCDRRYSRKSIVTVKGRLGSVTTISLGPSNSSDRRLARLGLVASYS